MTINSLSKTYSVTGWRVGWAISPASLTGAHQASCGARMTIHESITQETCTRIYWTMVLVEGIFVVQRIARVDPTRSSSHFVLGAYSNHCQLIGSSVATVLVERIGHGP